MLSPRRSEPCDGLVATVLDAVARGQVDRGPHLRVLETRVAALVQGRRRFPPGSRAAPSGLEALAELMAALEIPAGSRVVVGACGHGGLVPFLQALGYRVTTADAGDDRPVPSPATLDRACTPDVRCVIVSHLFGNATDVPALAAVARGRGAKVVEDGGHALGAWWHAEPVGSLADGATFRFDTGGALFAFGGGLAVADDPAVLRRLSLAADVPPPSTRETLARVLAEAAADVSRAEGLRRLLGPVLDADPVRPLAEWADGALRLRAPDGPVRALSNLQARLGLLALEALPRRLARRRAVARRLLEALDLHDPRLDEESPDRSAPSDVVVRVPPGHDGADAVRDLRAAGVPADRGPALADDAGALAGEDRPGARAWLRRAVRLPGPADLDDRELHRCCAALGAFRGRLVI